MAESDKKILRLTCPICQTRLKVAEGIPRFACLNCGTELDVVTQEGEMTLEPSPSAIEKLTPSELELARLNKTLKEKDDSYGVGCAVATLGVTLVACVSILLANAFQSTLLFWLTVITALVILAVILMLFITASNRDIAPLIRQRDHLQEEVAREQNLSEDVPEGPQTESEGV